jgi:hypothetical protein
MHKKMCVLGGRRVEPQKTNCSIAANDSLQHEPGEFTPKKKKGGNGEENHPFRWRRKKLPLFVSQQQNFGCVDDWICE